MIVDAEFRDGPRALAREILMMEPAREILMMEPADFAAAFKGSAIKREALDAQAQCVRRKSTGMLDATLNRNSR